MAMLLLCLIYLNRQHGGTDSKLTLLNIEALASGENSGNYQCFGIGSLDCPQISTKVYYIRNF